MKRRTNKPGRPDARCLAGSLDQASGGPAAPYADFCEFSRIAWGAKFGGLEPPAHSAASDPYEHIYRQAWSDVWQRPKRAHAAEPARQGPALDFGQGPFIRLCPGDVVTVTGTLSALKAEGWVPERTALPNGDCAVEWTAPAARLCLRCAKPQGWSGPRCEGHALDWWEVRVFAAADTRAARDALDAIAAERLARATSPAGRRACLAAWRALMSARADQAFQCLLAKVLPPLPELQRFGAGGGAAHGGDRQP